jgi:putative ABC transport system permease protein
MIAVVLGGLRTRKLRAAMTAIAIVLGVAMISGTYVLMDTTLHAFDSLFATAYSKAQVVVQGKSPIPGTGVRAPSVPAAVLARIRALPEVRDAPGTSRIGLSCARGTVARRPARAPPSLSACRVM